MAFEQTDSERVVHDCDCGWNIAVDSQSKLLDIEEGDTPNHTISRGAMANTIRERRLVPPHCDENPNCVLKRLKIVP